MNTAKFLTSTRPGAFLQLAALLTLAPLLSIPQAAAFTPQDSTHVDFTFQKLPGETTWWFARVANQRVYYSANSGVGSPIRARNFAGDLVFEYVDPQGEFAQGCGVAADGRLYYFSKTGQYTGRVSIVGPNGIKLGDFGPNGLGTGAFGLSGSSAERGVIAVSPVTGRVYVIDQVSGSGTDPAKYGQIRVFDRDGNYLHQFRTNGILASTLEGFITQIAVRGDAQGQDELYVVDSGANFKVFGGDGQFRRLVTGGIFDGNDNYLSALNTVVVWEDRLVITQSISNYSLIRVFPAAVAHGSEILAEFASPYNKMMGVHTSGGLICGSAGQGGESLVVYSYPNFSNFDAVKRDAVPNPWVLGVTQRPGSGIVDIDYRVDDKDDEEVTTALVAFANGTVNLTNVLPMNTLTEGTASRVGAEHPTGTVQRVTWNAGTDWNVDFGTLRVMALARDSRTHWFDTHLVEIPADGVRPAVTISRNPLREDDFLAQLLWLVATKDPSVELIDGVLFGTTGADDGVILANGATSTVAGRTFLLKRDGLRIATAAEVARAREGATPGFEVKLTPPLQMARTNPAGGFPNQINEFGIETGPIGTAWYVVRESAE